MDSIQQESEIDEIFTRLQIAYISYSKDPSGNMKAKAKLRSVASELSTALQTPQEAANIFTMSSSIHPCYRAASQCGILTAWPKQIMSAVELAEKTGADSRLIVRLMRVLLASGMFKEVGEDLYAHNKLSTSLSNPISTGMVKFMAPGISRLPEYLAATSYRNPGSTPEVATLFQYGNNTPLSFYQALAKDDISRPAFDGQMKRLAAIQRAQNPTGFASGYDFEGELGSLITSADHVAVVDVGGSQGHVLEDIRKHLPNLKGRLVLEDLPETLESVSVPEGVEAVPYNFLESIQPIKGAACYLFRQIFLNWNDANGLLILKNTIPSLKPGHSRIVIMEQTFPAVGAPLLAALLDIQMAQMGGGIRSEKQWRAFLAEAGLELTKFLPAGPGYTAIEAMPKV